MGLFGWLFKGSGPIQSGATGALLGGAIGDRLDAQHDRQEIIKLLKLQLAQNTYHHEMAAIDRQMGMYDEYNAKVVAAAKAWQWNWQIPSELGEPLYNNYFRQLAESEEYRQADKELSMRWWDLYARSLRVGIMPLGGYRIYIPRSKFGDVAGTEKTLTIAMDKLEARVVEYERLKEIERKFGG